MEELIQEGQDLISIVNIEKLKDRYDTWCQRVMILLRTEGFSKEDQHEFIVKAHYTNNEFFPVESQKSILNAIKDATAFLDSIKSFTGSKISEETALTIVERILKIFICTIKQCTEIQCIKVGSLYRKYLIILR